MAGTANPQYAAGPLAEVQEATGGEAMVIEGANHSLEIEGEIVESIEVMRQVIERMEAFFEK